MKDTRYISLEIGDPPIRKPVTISLCESSASIDFEKTTVHIPWSEISQWIMWFIENFEE